MNELRTSSAFLRNIEYCNFWGLRDDRCLFCKGPLSLKADSLGTEEAEIMLYSKTNLYLRTQHKSIIEFLLQNKSFFISNVDYFFNTYPTLRSNITFDI